MLSTILILNFTFPTFQNPNLEFRIFQQEAEASRLINYVNLNQHVFFKNQHVKVSNMLREVTC